MHPSDACLILFRNEHNDTHLPGWQSRGHLSMQPVFFIDLADSFNRFHQ